MISNRVFVGKDIELLRYDIWIFLNICSDLFRVSAMRNVLFKFWVVVMQLEPESNGTNRFPDSFNSYHMLPSGTARHLLQQLRVSEVHFVGLPIEGANHLFSRSPATKSDKNT